MSQIHVDEGVKMSIESSREIIEKKFNELMESKEGIEYVDLKRELMDLINKSSDYRYCIDINLPRYKKGSLATVNFFLRIIDESIEIPKSDIYNDLIDIYEVDAIIKKNSSQNAYEADIIKVLSFDRIRMNRFLHNDKVI